MYYMAARPQSLPGETLAMETNCGRLYVTVNRDPVTGEPVELFCRFGKAGGCGSAIMDGLTRLVRAGLRSGLSPGDIVASLGGISCHRGARTCLDVVAAAVGEAMSRPPLSR